MAFTRRVEGMSGDALISRLIREFLRRSRASVDALAGEIAHPPLAARPDVDMFRFDGDLPVSVRVPGRAFFLRTSVEYANPQLTLEELEGVVVARLLEVTASFIADHRTGTIAPADVAEMGAALARPPAERVVPFLLNVDDIEADRYSINPLRTSILSSGQSGRAVDSVRGEGLRVDAAFMDRYSGSLVVGSDAEEIQAYLDRRPEGRYVDLVDAIKYVQLRRVSDAIGIDLTLPAIRMPLATLASETASGPLHRMVSAMHADRDSLARIYRLFGRDLDHDRTFLPVVPHAADGSASKRLARGRYRWDGPGVGRLNVRYSSGPLYPNEVAPSDVAIARADAETSVEWDELSSFEFRRTPASPQFALYMLLSPEDGAIWHGVGRFAGARIVQSYARLHRACATGEPFEEVHVSCRPDPLQWDLVAESMLRHPRFGNIDASVACVEPVELETSLPRSIGLRVLMPRVLFGASAKTRTRPSAPPFDAIHSAHIAGAKGDEVGESASYGNPAAVLGTRTGTRAACVGPAVGPRRAFAHE